MLATRRLCRSSRHKIAGELDFSGHAPDAIGTVGILRDQARHGFAVLCNHDAFRLEVVQNRQALLVELRSIEVFRSMAAAYVDILSDWSIYMALYRNLWVE